MSILLEAQGVGKYFGGLKAVDGVDMAVRKGDIFGIIGPNGAGKTTFFNICSGFYSPTHGTIRLRGERISGMSPERIARRGMTRTFQNIQLFKFMSVLENVKIGFHSQTRTRLMDAILRNRTYRQDEAFVVEQGTRILDKVGLAQYRDTPAGNLPYGLQRKVEIARALAMKPEILLLDEPAAGMNPLETQSLLQLIKDLSAEGHTLVVIEHDMHFVMNACNRILVLNFGQKICEGAPNEVKSDPRVQEAYFGKGLLTAAGRAVCHA